MSNLRDAASVMRLDAATAEAVEALRTRGIRAILLKGPVLTRWLYEHRLDRVYGDIDLLVAPHDFDAAGQALRSLGYRDVVPERRFGLSSGVDDSYAKHLHRDSRRSAHVDLHRGFVWSTMDPVATWETLRRHTEKMVVGGTELIVLGPAALALIVALHAAQHGPVAGPLEDLDRALRRFDQTTWRGAASLARELRVEEAFAAGLRLRPPGLQLAERLGLTKSASVEVRLRSGGDTPLALTVHQLRSEPSLRRRLTLLYGKALPSAAYMRTAYPTARRGHVGLIWAHLQRVADLARLLPHARRALRAAERKDGGPA